MLLLPLSEAQSQSITNGWLTGVVQTADGTPLSGAGIRITEVTTGVSWWLVTSSAGRFGVSLLPPGEYEVFAEKLGYQPKLVQSVPVFPGRRQRLTITLALADLPVDQVERAPYPFPVEHSRAAIGQWFTPFEINGLPEQRRAIDELGRLSTVSNGELETEGLPGSLSGIVVDGIAYAPARHTDLAPSPLDNAVFRLSEFQTAELLTNGLDVEWSGFAGGYLSSYTSRGTADLEVRGFADWTGSAVTSSKDIAAPAEATRSVRGGAVISGPVIPDTAHFLVGVEAQSLETPMPPAWEIHTFDEGLVAVADSFGVDLTPYTETLVLASELVSTFGRFDWNVTQNHAISLRGSFAALKTGGAVDRDPGLGLGHLASLASEIDGLDYSAGGSLASTFSAGVSNEFQVGFDVTRREYAGTSLLGTGIVDGGLGFGTDPTVPADFKTLALGARETLHLTFPNHRFKIGLAATYIDYDQKYSHASGGVFDFSGVEDFSRLEGVFGQTVGSTPIGDFTTQQYSIYLQDLWSAAPGLDILVGLRYEYEHRDKDAIRLAEAWLQLTGISNKAFSTGENKWSPRFGVVWDVGGQHRWLIQGGSGIYHNLVEPDVFGEAVSHSKGVEYRKAVGALGSWPGAPDATVAPVLGPRLSILGTTFKAPRTARSSLGFVRLFGGGASLMISGTYRHTDYLSRRHDLNLPLSPVASDQDGRPIYGTLIQQGSLVTVSPSSNRRFPQFDLVSALDPDGASDYWGGTFAFERQVKRGFSLYAAYTFSYTRDNQLTGHGGGPEAQLTPFPDSLDGTDWAHGRSDLDVPHRVVIAAEVDAPRIFAGLRLSAFYRFRSGAPFTPGFRNGVDVNGDGSASNDPAFVDASIPGMDSLLERWDCLRDQVGGFAERNSCRQAGVHTLDARIALGLVQLQNHSLELAIDALNILDTDARVPDRALFLIDAESSISTAADGTVTLPLVVNPRFGGVLARKTTGRVFRFGLRLGL